MQGGRSGEREQLLTGTNPVFDFTYGTTFPWPGAADGNGPSLEPISYNISLNISTNWRASSLSGGSPGKKNPPPAMRVMNIVRDGTSLRFSFPGTAGAGYVILSADSLSAAQWQPVMNIDALTEDRAVDVSLDVDQNTGTKFFRVSSQ